jgi:NhaA family Na+:H+ antiporter
MVGMSLPIYRRRLQYLIAPFIRFARLESSSSIVLLLAATIALGLANSPFAPIYESQLNMPVSIGVGATVTSWTLHDFVADMLMSFFFLVVGLEVKREFLVGELRSPRYAMLPVFAALGGVITPAVIYFAFNHHRPTQAGWGIPIATDIAFSLAILSLFGKRVPTGLKVFLVTLAIVDDIVGVLVIAIAYTNRLHLAYLTVAASLVLFCWMLNWLGVTQPSSYMIMGFALWWAVRASGLHSTLSGILLAMTIPARSFMAPATLLEQGRTRFEGFANSVSQVGPSSREARQHLHSIRSGIELYESPLDRLQTKLHPWVSFGIMPLFALTNADISLPKLQVNAFSHPVFVGILLGLLLGKPFGITLFTWIAVRFHLAILPKGITWTQLQAVAWLGGIGFTISIFIAGLAFGQDQEYTIARIAVMAASILAAGMGSLFLVFALRPYHGRSGT